MMKRLLLCIILFLALVLPALAADPWAGYTPPSISGAEPLSVTFTDISYGAPDHYYWNRTNVNIVGALPVTFSTSASPGSVTFYRCL
jgi:PKD repeat protein